MKEALLLLLLIPAAAAADIQGYGVEATEINNSLDRPVYEAFKIESIEGQEISFTVPPSWADRNGFIPAQITVIDSNTQIYSTTGFENYTAQITEPGEYYITGYRQKTLAENNRDCTEFIEPPENYTEVSECSQGLQIPQTSLKEPVFIAAGLILAALTVLLGHRIGVKAVDSAITRRTHALTSENAEEEKLKYAMKANEQASQDHYLAAFKALLKTYF